MRLVETPSSEASMDRASIESKFWRENATLSTPAKLVYAYLYTCQDLKITGVVETAKGVIQLELGLAQDELQSALNELIKAKYIEVLNIEPVIYIVLKAFDRYNGVRTHFKYHRQASAMIKQLPERVRKAINA